MTGGTAGSGRRIVFPALVAAFLGALALSAATGPVAIPFRTFADALLHGGDDTPARVLLSLRLPRALLGALVGGALASSGVGGSLLLARIRHKMGHIGLRLDETLARLAEAEALLRECYSPVRRIANGGSGTREDLDRAEATLGWLDAFLSPKEKERE